MLPMMFKKVLKSTVFVRTIFKLFFYIMVVTVLILKMIIYKDHNLIKLKCSQIKVIFIISNNLLKLVTICLEISNTNVLLN